MLTLFFSIILYELMTTPWVKFSKILPRGKELYLRCVNPTHPYQPTSLQLLNNYMNTHNALISKVNMMKEMFEED